jgi:CheY-like chemotaxis protein
VKMVDALQCMLIDDDLDDHEIFSLALQELDIDVKLTSVYNAHQAISLLESGKFFPDFIFLDLNMPRVNGKQCLVEIKSIPANKSIPVVIYSTSSEIRDLVEVQHLGAEAYIVKSSSIKDLVAALRDFFESKHEA